MLTMGTVPSLLQRPGLLRGVLHSEDHGGQLVVFVVSGFVRFFLFLFLVVPVGVAVGKVLKDVLKVVQPVHQIVDVIIRQ